MKRAVLAALLASVSWISLPAQTPHFSGEKAIAYAQQFVNCGPRYNGSPGLACAQAYIKKQFAHDNLEDDAFSAATPAGRQSMQNFIIRFPGKKDGVIVLASHYETNYPLRNTSFVGANDGAATSGLLMEIADQLRGKTLEGYSVWLVFLDGEEAVQEWSSSDSLYGSRHLAAKWATDGTLKKIKGFLLADMIGDRDLDITRSTSSTPAMEDLVYAAAKKLGYEKYFYKTSADEEDDHIPFMMRGVPCAEVIDVNYGPRDENHPDGWHHTPEDTMDKVSAKSLAISGSVFLESIRLLNQK